MRQIRIGELDVRIAGGADGSGGGDGPVVVLLHGFGAPGDDLVPLARFLDLDRETRFVFPAAPMELPAFLGESRAWWMIDMEALERDMAAGRPRDRSDEVPEGMAEANAMVSEVLDALPGELGGTGPLVLGGFSQGAMLSLDLALRSRRRLAGLVLLSGTFLAADEWRPRMGDRAGLPVFQSHGRADPLLPFPVAERLRDELRSAGLAVEWHPFDGAHEIPPHTLTSLSEFLRRTLADAGTG